MNEAENTDYVKSTESGGTLSDRLFRLAPVEKIARRGDVDGADTLLLEPEDRYTTIDGGLEHAEKVLALAKREAGYSQRFPLFSGGNDSLVLLHVLHFQLAWPMDGVLHINTGTGVRETDPDGTVHFLTTEFAQRTVEGWGLPFIERRPPLSYEQAFIGDPIINGLPGPGMHQIAYDRLKGRAVAAFVKDTKRHYWDRMLFASGVRHDESVKRMGYGDRVVNRERSQVWCNPIFYFTNEMMAAYRTEHDIPKNPVSAHLGMSGECLCGCYATPTEKDEIEFFYPDTRVWINGCEEAARNRGLKYASWGYRRSDADRRADNMSRSDELQFFGPGGPMCKSCDRRMAVAEAAEYDCEPVR